MAHRSPAQLALRGRVEALIGVAAPLLDVVLFAGDRIARVAGRNDIEPEPPRRVGTRPAARISGPRPRPPARRPFE
jgi:hypothetical protein